MGLIMSKPKPPPAPSYSMLHANLPDGSAVPYPLHASKSSLCSVMEGERILDGFASISRVEANLSQAQDNPQDRPRQFEKSRHWWKHHEFVRPIILLRYSFFSYGFQIKSEDGKPSARLKKWEENNRRMYRRYARECWLEWLPLDNVVGLWWRKGMHPPVVYPPERTIFEDIFGHERIKIKHGVNREYLTTFGTFSVSQVKEFQVPEIEIDHDHKTFGFDILRRERMGSGFGIPTIAPLFVTLAEMQSTEVGLQSLAAACRRVDEHHYMGYEIKSGIHAGAAARHMNLTRANGFKDALKGKTGHNIFVLNFDHKTVQAANWPDPKCYDAKKFQSAYDRIALWAMPLGQMVLGKTVNPYLLPMLKYQAIAEREYVGEHLCTVFREALGAPAEIKCVWSNKCFADPRIAADLSKIALASGPQSQKTFLEEIGLDQEEEWANKEVEAGKSKKLTTPIFDAAHGEKKPAGRKPGTKDGDGE